MGSSRDVERNKLVLIRVSEEELEILKKLRKERHMTISELIHEALVFIDGDLHAC